ncbi:MAG: TorF family putative porin [Rhodanobacteraceae bacterium]
MHKSLLNLAAVALSATLGTQAAAASLTGSAALTSDYVFRGISQTNGHPALQGGVQYQAENGWYVASWASTLDPYPANGAKAELDLSAGWQGALTQELTLNATLTRYTYPGAHRASTDYNELLGTLTWRDHVWLMTGWSDDAFASGHSALYSQIGLRLPLAGMTVEPSLGYYALSDALGRSYMHGDVALVKSVDKFTFRLAGHFTDRAARKLFSHLAGSRVELSASIDF